MFDAQASVALIDALKGDVVAGLDFYSSSNHSPFSLRTYVRAFFAYVEGWAYLSKQMVLEEPILHVVAPTAKEQSILRGDRFIPLDDNIKFVFAVTSKCFGSTYKLDASGREWQAFRDSIQIRNRLMHPKKPADLTLSPSEFEAAREAQLWFFRVALEHQNATRAALNAQRPAAPVTPEDGS